MQHQGVIEIMSTDEPEEGKQRGRSSLDLGMCLSDYVGLARTVYMYVCMYVAMLYVCMHVAVL